MPAPKYIVLLIDDDLDDAEIFADTLAEIAPSIGFLHVSDGETALALLQNQSIATPDIIFLDLNMPEMSGWQCLTKLRSNPVTKGIPVYIYSTSSHPLDKRTAADLGAARFISKPSDYQGLRMLIDSIVNELYVRINAISR